MCDMSGLWGKLRAEYAKCVMWAPFLGTMKSFLLLFYSNGIIVCPGGVGSRIQYCMISTLRTSRT